MSKRKERFVKVAFPGSYKVYTYRTYLNLKPADKVVIYGARGFGIARVVEFDTEKPEGHDINAWAYIKLDIEELRKDIEE